MQACEGFSQIHADPRDVELRMLFPECDRALSGKDGHQSALGLVNRGQKHGWMGDGNVVPRSQNGFRLGLQDGRESGLGIVTGQTEKLHGPVVDLHHEEVMVGTLTRGLDLAHRPAAASEQVQSSGLQGLLVLDLWHCLQVLLPAIRSPLHVLVFVRSPMCPQF